MKTRPIQRSERLALAKSRWRRLAARSQGDAALRRLVALVVACVPEFGLVIVRTREHLQYTLTPDTEGVELASLREGATVACFVAGGSARVVRAQVIRR